MRPVVQGTEVHCSRMDALDRRLLAFHNAVRHLGSSVGIFVAAVTLRERLTAVTVSFRNHSSIAFPAIGQSDYDTPQRFRTVASDSGEKEKSGHDEVIRPDLGDISRCLEDLAMDLERFLDVRTVSTFR